MVGCGGNGGDGSADPGTGPPPAQFEHTPQLLTLELLLDSAMHMEGNGEVAVTAMLEVADAGQDIETVTINVSNGVDLSFDVSGLVNDPTGTITQEFNVATTEIGRLTIRFQLVDAAGSRSARQIIDFLVDGDPYTWHERLTGLPNTLNAVTANAAEGSGFIAVGDGGTIMTSDDGLTWTSEVSPTNVDLNFVTCDPDLSGMGVPGRCFAAGDAGTVLASPSILDGSVSWTTWFDGPDDVSLHFFYFDPFFGEIAAGTSVTTDVACVLHGNFITGPWTIAEPLAQGGQYITDLITRVLDAGDPFVLQYLATVEVSFPEQAKVLVSNDLETWVEVFVSDDHGSTYSILDRWISGSGGKMYASSDGINWTQYETPATQSNLIAMSSHNGILMAHGFSETIGMGEQVGVATSDDGETWQTFVIGAAYEPRDLAYNDGRWVSVGQSLAEPGKGAIFTTQ
jgi:hypothetical protein